MNRLHKYSMINGVATDYLNINDRAIHYGDGLFETILCSDNRLYYWEQHYQRLQQSSEKLKISCPDEQLLLADIKTLLANKETAEANNYAIKIIISRGTGERGYKITKSMKANRLVLLSPLAKDYSSLLAGRLFSGELYLCKQQVSINENLAGLKHLNRLDNVMARSEWDDTGNIIEGLMLNANQHVIEGTMSNLFAVRDNQLFTPGLKQSGVKGVMRDAIIKISEQVDISLSIISMSIDELLEMDEIFITNSLIGMKSISQFNGKQYRQTDITKLIFATLLTTKHNYVQVI